MPNKSFVRRVNVFPVSIVIIAIYIYIKKKGKLKYKFGRSGEQICVFLLFIIYNGLKLDRKRYANTIINY